MTTYKAGDEVVRTQIAVGMRGIIQEKAEEYKASYLVCISHIPDYLSLSNPPSLPYYMGRVGSIELWNAAFFTMYKPTRPTPLWEI